MSRASTSSGGSPQADTVTNHTSRFRISGDGHRAGWRHAVYLFPQRGYGTPLCRHLALPRNANRHRRHIPPVLRDNQAAAPYVRTGTKQMSTQQTPPPLGKEPGVNLESTTLHLGDINRQMSDMDSEKRRLSALQENAARLLDQSPNLVFLFDEDLKLQAASRACLSLVPFNSVEDIKMMRPWQIFDKKMPPDWIHKLCVECLKVMESRLPCKYNYQTDLVSGTESMDMHISISPVTDGEGTLTWTLVAISNITEATATLQGSLRHSFIQILAEAIDGKSGHTGGHCARVPVIFQMLLQAACDAHDGPLANFTLDKNGWEAAMLAGWLHDFGKVTTPEYVMDKATKLETLYDRIHEVRMRFEVLKRDAEITYWKAVAEGADAEAKQRELLEAHSQLDDDFAFVASCNLGTEAMDVAAVERLGAIGRRTWTRTLDKRLGVSRGERERMDKANVPPAPVTECLLADNPEHIIPRTSKDMLPPENRWNFKLDVPDALYNRGELHNLSIRAGTLTLEERYKINDHITRTIMMLERLPLSKELSAAREIVAAHHETMDGKGYPRRLVREEMSWPARIMAVADIFEALTAWDRPYKDSKKLSEALKIMDGFKERDHIDPDVYELFLRSGIPQRYAAEYLHPEQNDLGSNATEMMQPLHSLQVTESNVLM